MPTNKKEGLIFGIMMCFGMVFIMSIYNLLINGTIGSFSITTIFELVIGFIIALVLDLFIVGPLAKTITAILPIDRSKKVYVILTMTTCMVTGMVLFMSAFGLAASALSHGLSGTSILNAYMMIVLKNFILAYPLQLLIMGPLVRGIFVKFVKGKMTAAAAN